MQEAFYYLGRVYHSSYRFDDAIDYYKHYKALIKSNTANYLLKENVYRKVEMCNNGKILVSKPNKVLIKNLGSVINTYYDEYTPVISADKSVLIFTSSRPDGIKSEKDIDGNYFEDIFITKNKATSWPPSERLDSVPKLIKGKKVSRVVAHFWFLYSLYVPVCSCYLGYFSK